MDLAKANRCLQLQLQKERALAQQEFDKLGIARLPDELILSKYALSCSVVIGLLVQKSEYKIIKSHKYLPEKSFAANKYFCKLLQTEVDKRRGYFISNLAFNFLTIQKLTVTEIQTIYATKLCRDVLVDYNQQSRKSISIIDSADGQRTYEYRETSAAMEIADACFKQLLQARIDDLASSQVLTVKTQTPNCPPTPAL